MCLQDMKIPFLLSGSYLYRQLLKVLLTEVLTEEWEQPEMTGFQ